MKKLMYIGLFFLLAATAAAKNPYVIDSVCINGMDRYYRIVGDEGYTYNWFIIDTVYNDTTGVVGIDFADTTATDTILGNEIAIIWDRPGVFEIAVEVYSEHFCDTLEQGIVKVFDPPFVEAGDPYTYCDFQDITLTTDYAEFYSGMFWETRGDGYFTNRLGLHPTYHLGAADSLAQSVTLVLTAYGLADNETCEPAIDSVTFDFTWPEILVSVDSILCFGDSSASITATVTGGQEPYNYEWEGPAGFVSTNTNTITGLWAGTYVLIVTDANLCVDTDTIILSDPPQLLASIDNSVDVSCYGYSDGSITASATGGTGVLQFNWTSLGGATYSGNFIENLPIDTYYLMVTDENSCVDLDTVIIEQPNTLLVQVVAFNSILCENEETVIQTDVVGGTGKVDVSWSGTGSAWLDATNVKDVIFSNAPEGNYQLIVKIIDEAGCEASDTIEINVYPPSYSFEAIEVCAFTAPFTWNHRTIISDFDSIYQDTLFGLNQYGCDSILTLDVKILFPERLDTTLYVCENEEPFIVFNQTILPGHDSIYFDTIPYVVSGCDSLLITINVNTLPVTYAFLDSTLCAGAPEFVWNNVTILTEHDSIYLDTMVNSFGCDSLLTYDVKIIPPDTFYVDTTMCQDEPVFVWNTIEVHTLFDSTYQATLTNIYGCDSIVNLSVHIIPSTDTIIDTMLCFDTPAYAWNNLTIFAEHDSTYLDTLVNAAGCDSLLTLNVTIMYPDTINLDTMLCVGESEFAWNTHTVFAFEDSIYSETLTNSFGCDSIVNLAVRILVPRDSIEIRDVCENDVLDPWYGHTILPYVDSIYYDTLYYEAGCDSLRLKLEIITHPVQLTEIDTVICEGSPGFDWNGRPVSTFVDSTYIDLLFTSWGCDSTVILNVKVIPTYKDTIPEVICFGEPLADWYGQAISSEVDSIYMHSIPHPLGCDTLLFYEVTVLPVTYAVIDTTLCAGIDSIKLNNVWIPKDSSRIYFDTIPNSYGCDSLLTYNVTITPPDTVLVYDTICYGELVADWNGIPIQSLTDDVYEATLTNSENCDSVVILYTTIIEGTFAQLDTAVCETFTWVDGDENTYTRDTIVDWIIGNETCGDTMRLNLIVSQPIIIDIDFGNVLCYGDSTGFANLTYSGGIAPYRFIWNGVDTIQNLSNLPAGKYEIEVIDSLGCSNSYSFEITQPDPISIDLDTIIHVETRGDSTGSIEVDVDGGTAPYDFVWTNETGDVVGTDEGLLNQPAGDYTLTVIDANICVTSQTFTIEEPQLTACLDDLVLTCYEDLELYPLITSFEEYLTYLAPGQVIEPGCGIDTASFTSEVDTIWGANCYEEIRYYTLFDICNGDTLFHCVQSVIVNDDEKPIISCPPDRIITNNVVPAAYKDRASFIAGGGSFTDNCGIVSFRHIGDVSDGGTDPEIITRTYEVGDYCGNISTCEQVFEVYRSAEFVIECGDLPASYNCVAELPKYDLNSFRADGGYAYSYPYEIVDFRYTDKSDNRTCPETITRTYFITANDSTISCTKIYIIDDNTPPTLILSDKNIYCGASWPVYQSIPDILRYTGNDVFDQDDCGNILRSTLRNLYFRTQTISGTCPTIIERTYAVDDRCGNISQNVIERIFVWDTIPPVITNFPTDTVVACDFPLPYTDASLFATDDCAPVQMTHRDSLSADEPGVLYRIYTFTDGCNPVEVVQKITIEFTGIPVFATIDPICQFGLAPILPDTSLNGISGYWLPDTILTNEAGTIEYMFYPDSGQCALPVSLTVTVTPAVEIVVVDTIHQGYNPNPVGAIDIQVNGGSPDFEYSWSNGETTEDIADLFAGTYTVVVTDAYGCIDSATVEITAGQAEFSCLPDTIFECPDVSVYPPASNINEYINYGGTYKPVDIISGFRSYDDTINSEYCLTVLRTYIIENSYGQVDSCKQIINFHDTIPPVIIAPEGETAECVSTIIPDIQTLADFIAFSGFVDDNCAIDSSSFTVSEPRKVNNSPGVTEITVVYSISDVCGNMSYDSTTYIATDTIAPVVICNDITVYLDENGNYVLTKIDLDTLVNATDNCTPLEDMIIQVDYNQFTCIDVDELNEIIITVYDMAGNSGTCTARITVLDTFPPAANCEDITVYLDENGQVTITADMIDNGSTDNCWPLDTMYLSKDQFDCYDVGENPVYLIVVDMHGKVDSCESVVTVIDTIPPVIECIPPFTIQLDENAQYTLSVFDVYLNSDDECGIDTMYLDRYELDCDDIGITTITLTVVDVNGNESTCFTEIIVFGNVAPIAQNDSAVTLMNQAVQIPILENDYDQEDLNGTKTTIDSTSVLTKVKPRNGNLTVNPNSGVMTYTPKPGFIGTDTLVYQICDDAIPCTPMCDTAFVFIRVLAENIPPVAVNDYYTANCSEATGNLLDNDYDLDGNITINKVPLKLPIHGYIIIEPNGSFIYYPDAGFNGTDSLMYEICDDGLTSMCDTAWVYITKYPDADCDGVADFDDIDDDNDGIIDIVEMDYLNGVWVDRDTDDDGIPDRLDIDSDNDGIPDNIEGQGEFDYILPIGVDANNNGWDDVYDPEEGGYQFVPVDTDGDGIPDYLDLDSDGDGVWDFIEGHDINSDGIPDVFRVFVDSDRDGLDDAYDIVNGWNDPFSVINSLGSNAPLQDFDGDGTRDWRDDNDEDDEFMTIDEDNNSNGDWSDDDEDLDGYPDYLDKTLDCELFIPEGFSPNDDGVHDFFQILCIQKYPNAHLMIFNRNGDKLFDKEHYGNLDVWGTDYDAWWWGTSESTMTLGGTGGSLPAGNYVYVIELGNGEVKNGTVMISY